MAGAGIQKLDGQSTQDIAFVSYHLKRNLFGGFEGIGATTSYSGEDGWTGATPQYLNYFVPKESNNLYFEVQNLGDDLQTTINIDLFELAE